MGIRGVTDFFGGGGYHRFVDIPSQPRNALLPLPFNRSIPECHWAYPGSPQPRNEFQGCEKYTNYVYNHLCFKSELSMADYKEK